MSEHKFASLESQLYNSECEAEDTEEMFVLRCSDDYDSLISLGNALSGQYRFKEAAEIYGKALAIKADDVMLYIRLAGANLSLFRFDEAKKYYDAALYNGASKETTLFYYGMWHYLSGNYEEAAKCLTKCYPCDNEMKVSIIFWQTLACIMAGKKPELLDDLDGLDVKYHTAYKKISLLIKGNITIEDIEISGNSLDLAILNYGLFVYTKKEEYLTECLKNASVWPCVAYLAAWREKENS